MVVRCYVESLLADMRDEGREKALLIISSEGYSQSHLDPKMLHSFRRCLPMQSFSACVECAKRRTTRVLFAVFRVVFRDYR